MPFAAGEEEANSPRGKDIPETQSDGHRRDQVGTPAGRVDALDHDGVIAERDDPGKRVSHLARADLVPAGDGGIIEGDMPVVSDATETVIDSAHRTHLFAD